MVLTFAVLVLELGDVSISDSRSGILVVLG